MESMGSFVREMAMDFVPSISVLLTVLAVGAWVLGISIEGTSRVPMQPS